MFTRGALPGRALAAAAVVCLLAGCGGATKVGADHSATSTTSGVGAGASNSAQSSSTTTAGSGSTAAGSTAGSVPPTTTPGASPGAGPASTAAAPPSGPPAGTGAAPRVGSYKYESTDEKGNVTQLTLNVKTTKTAGAVADQTLTITSPQGSEQNDYTWDPATGVMVSSTTLSGEQGSVSCSWKPDIIQFSFALRNGASWNSLSNCTTTVAKTPATATYSNKAQVTGYQAIQIAGQTVNTWIIDRTTVLTLKSATFDLKITTVSAEYFAPADGETPKELTDTTTSGTYGGRNFSQETKATVEAESLQPS